MKRPQAAISPIYERATYKRKTKQRSHSHDSKDDALAHAIKWFGANERYVNELKLLQRSQSLTKDALEYNNYGRAVAALNKAKAFGEFYFLPKRSEPDPHNKITVKKSSRVLKTFVKPGEITGFTITRL